MYDLWVYYEDKREWECALSYETATEAWDAMVRIRRQTARPEQKTKQNSTWYPGARCRIKRRCDVVETGNIAG
jgi:hypothetical protein